MDKTIEYYNQNTQQYIEQTQHVDTSFLLNRLIDGLPLNSKVLDLGCGSGRDALYMQKKGMYVTAIDASHALINHLNLTSNIKAIQSTFEEYNPTEKYSLIYAVASLLHLNKKDFINTIHQYTKLLGGNGQLFFTVKMGNGEEIDSKGRYFNYYQIDDIKQIFKTLNLPQPFITISSDGLGRDTKWINVTHKQNPTLLNNSEKDMASVSEWMNTNIDNVLFEATQTSIQPLLNQINEMQQSYDEFPKDAKRTNKILKLLKKGNPALPLYIEKNDDSNFVMEGRHRMVAFKEMGMTEIPIVYVSLINNPKPQAKIKIK